MFSGLNINYFLYLIIILQFQSGPTGLQPPTASLQRGSGTREDRASLSVSARNALFPTRRPCHLRAGAGGTAGTSRGEADCPDPACGLVSSPLHPRALRRAWRRSGARRGEPVPPHGPAGVCTQRESRCVRAEALSLQAAPPDGTGPRGRRPQAPACWQFCSPACPAPAQGPGGQLPAPRKEGGRHWRCLDSGPSSPLQKDGRCGPARLS